MHWEKYSKSFKIVLDWDGLKDTPQRNKNGLVMCGLLSSFCAIWNYLSIIYNHTVTYNNKMQINKKPAQNIKNNTCAAYLTQDWDTTDRYKSLSANAYKIHFVYNKEEIVSK